MTVEGKTTQAAKASRDELFRKARELIIFNYRASVPMAQRELYPWFSGSTVERLMDFTYAGEADGNKFDTITKERLIKYVSFGTLEPIYKLLSNAIGQQDADTSKVIDDYCGSYLYFRYFSTHPNPNNIQFVQGRIDILPSTPSMPVFHHWSHDYKEALPEHTGFVFLCDGNIYLLGKARNLLRLSIARARPYNEPMTGLVLSVRRKHQQPFSSRFVICNSRNSDLINSLKNTSVNPNYRPGDRSVNGVARTLGELSFFEIVGDYENFYLG